MPANSKSSESAVLKPEHINDSFQWDTISLSGDLSIKHPSYAIMIYTTSADRLNSNYQPAFIIMTDVIDSNIQDKKVSVKQFRVDAEYVSFNRVHITVTRSQEHLGFLHIYQMYPDAGFMEFSCHPHQLVNICHQHSESSAVGDIKKWLDPALLLLEDPSGSDYRFDAKILYPDILFNPKLLYSTALEWSRGFYDNVFGYEHVIARVQKKMPFLFDLLTCFIFNQCGGISSYDIPPGVLQTFFKYDHDKGQKDKGFNAGIAYGKIAWWDPAWLSVLIQYCISYLQALCGDREKEDYCFHFNRGMGAH